jgi:hypothetical protein
MEPWLIRDAPPAQLMGAILLLMDENPTAELSRTEVFAIDTATPPVISNVTVPTLADNVKLVEETVLAQDGAEQSIWTSGAVDPVVTDTPLTVTSSNTALLFRSRTSGAARGGRIAGLVIRTDERRGELLMSCTVDAEPSWIVRS